MSVTNQSEPPEVTEEVERVAETLRVTNPRYYNAPKEVIEGIARKLLFGSGSRLAVVLKDQTFYDGSGTNGYPCPCVESAKETGFKRVWTGGKE